MIPHTHRLVHRKARKQRRYWRFCRNAPVGATLISAYWKGLYRIKHTQGKIIVRPRLKRLHSADVPFISRASLVARRV